MYFCEQLLAMDIVDHRHVLFVFGGSLLLSGYYLDVWAGTFLPNVMSHIISNLPERFHVFGVNSSHITYIPTLFAFSSFDREPAITKHTFSVIVPKTIGERS